jgi:hypothetical protein
MVPSVARRACDFDVVISGAHADIRLSERALEAFRELEHATHRSAIAQFRHLERAMQRFCASERPSLPEEKYKKLGNYSDGRHGTVAVYEFKSFQWRLYGAVLTVSGRKCFVGLRVDAAKKQRRADMSLLTDTAADVGKLEEHRRG